MPNSSMPPLQPPPPEIDPSASTTIRKPVASHTPLAVAHVDRNFRRLGLVSLPRITSATTSAMNGMKNVSSPAPSAVPEEYGSSGGADAAPPAGSGPAAGGAAIVGGAAGVPTEAGVPAAGRSRPHHRHTMAASWICSAQYGQAFIFASPT